MVINNRTQLFAYLNPEQRLLLLLCCKQSAESINEAKIRLARPFNWTGLIALGERHRLLPQLYKSIKEISLVFPVNITSELKDKYYSQTAHVIK